MRSARVIFARRMYGGPDASMGRPWWALIWGAALVLALSIAAYAYFWTNAWERARQNDGAIQAGIAGDAGRAYLLRDVEWPTVDPETGLIVSAGWEDWLSTVRYGRCGVFTEYRGHSIEFAGDWSAEVRRRLAAGEACGPRFPGRAVRLESIRARFQRDGDSAIALPNEGGIDFGGRRVSYSHGCVVVVDPSSGERLRPVGGYPPSDLQNSAVATVLLADDGLSLWVRLVKPDGRVGWFLVVDLATGTHLAAFAVDD